MKRWLLDIPLLLFDLWWTVYQWILIVLVMITMTVVAIVLLLAALGIRWGW